MKNIELMWFVESDSKFRRLDDSISDELVFSYLFNDPSVCTHLNRGSLQGYGFLFHEKCEINEYFNFGFTEEVVRDQHMYIVSQDLGSPFLIAHARALFEEHLFYQRMGCLFLDKVIPLHALAIVRENFFKPRPWNPDLEVFGDYESLVNGKISIGDLKAALLLFEETGFKLRAKDEMIADFKLYYT